MCHTPIRIYRTISAIALMVFFFACSGKIDSGLIIPEHFPSPTFPKDNYPTEARIALGKKLFFDKNISIDSTVSCNSCHKQAFAFADSLRISPGVRGNVGFRNTPSLANLAYLGEVNRDGGVVKLDLQAVVPIEDHNEMDISLVKLSSRLSNDLQYVEMAAQAYGKAPNAYVITRALGSYVRTLISGESSYDKFLIGNTKALSVDQNKGRALFFSDRLGCGDCHNGFNLTNNSYQNIGLYDDYEDAGRERITLKSSDAGKMRVPSLRNVAVTAPYMHDGSLPSLEAVLDHYSSGGKAHPNKSKKIKPLDITEDERKNLLAFLESLTDSTFISNSQQYK